MEETRTRGFLQNLIRVVQKIKKSAIPLIKKDASNHQQLATEPPMTDIVRNHVYKEVRTLSDEEGEHNRITPMKSPSIQLATMSRKSIYKSPKEVSLSTKNPLLQQDLVELERKNNREKLAREMNDKQEISRLQLIEQQQNQLHQVEEQKRKAEELFQLKSRQLESDYNRARDRQQSIEEGNRLSHMCQVRQEFEEQISKLKKQVEDQRSCPWLNASYDNYGTTGQNPADVARQETALAHRMVKEFDQEEVNINSSTTQGSHRGSHQAGVSTQSSHSTVSSPHRPTQSSQRQPTRSSHSTASSQQQPSQSYASTSASGQQNFRTEPSDATLNQQSPTTTELISAVLSIVKHHWIDDGSSLYWKQVLRNLRNYNALRISRFWATVETACNATAAYAQLQRENPVATMKAFVEMQESFEVRARVAIELRNLHVPLSAVEDYLFNIEASTETPQQQQGSPSYVNVPTPQLTNSDKPLTSEPMVTSLPANLAQSHVPMEVEELAVTSGATINEESNDQQQQNSLSLQPLDVPEDIEEESASTILCDRLSAAMEIDPCTIPTSPQGRTVDYGLPIGAESEQTPSRRQSQGPPNCTSVKQGLLKKRILNDILTDQNVPGSERLDKCFHRCLQEFNFELGEQERQHLKELIETFHSKCLARWRQAHRFKPVFESQSGEWLDSDFMVPKEWFEVAGQLPSPTTTPSHKKSYEDKSKSGKQKEENSLSSKLMQLPQDLLIHGIVKTLKNQGNKGLADVIKFYLKTEHPEQVLTRLKKVQKEISPYTPEEALGLVLETGLSKAAYLKIRSGAKSHGCDLYPSYSNITTHKSFCRPENVEIQELQASVPLQDLLNHTTHRLVELSKEKIIATMNDRQLHHEFARLVCSWGFDGTTGQSTYKTKYAQSTSLQPDTALFATTMIPLKLIGSAGETLWENPAPSSVRFCRPIKYQYIKETRELILEEKQNIENQIRALQDIEVQLDNGKSFTVHVDLHMTLIDGKVLSIITGTPSFQSCPMCGATPLTFNNVNNMETNLFQPREGHLEYGLSPLHSWIRLLEWCLHLAYRQEFKQWRTTNETKELLEKKKLEIQQRIRAEMGLLVDIPKPGGSGTTNDGNTARRAFQDYKTFSRILNIDETFVRDLRTLLIAISSQEALNADAFETFSKKLVHRYVTLYRWFPMPETAHKLFIHGAEVIRRSVLPIGFFTEQGAESRHKLTRNDRVFHARKATPLQTMADVFNRALDTSDPCLSSHYEDIRRRRRRNLELPEDVQQLFAASPSQPLRDDPESRTTPEQLSDDVGDLNVHDEDDDIDRLLDTFELPEGDTIIYNQDD